MHYNETFHFIDDYRVLTDIAPVNFYELDNGKFITTGYNNPRMYLMDL